MSVIIPDKAKAICSEQRDCLKGMMVNATKTSRLASLFRAKEDQTPIVHKKSRSPCECDWLCLDPVLSPVWAEHEWAEERNCPGQWFRCRSQSRSRTRDSGQGKGAIVRQTGDETGIMRNPSYLMGWEDNIYLGYTFENTVVVTTNQESGDEFLDLQHPFLQNSKNVFKFRVVMATTFYTCKSCQIDR